MITPEWNVTWRRCSSHWSEHFRLINHGLSANTATKVLAGRVDLGRRDEHRRALMYRCYWRVLCRAWSVEGAGSESDLIRVTAG